MKKLTMRQSSALKKTMRELSGFTAAMLGVVLLSSCHARLHQIPEPDDRDKVPVTISVNNLGNAGYIQSKGMVDVGEVCSSLSFCIYPCDGESFDKIQINQTRDDASYGTVSQNLTVGTHRIVVVAHNGDKNPTMTNPESIAFSSNTVMKTTDTFCWAGDVNVTQETGTVTVTLTRATAMFRLKLTDSAVPSQVSELQFAYKGGSAAVNPFTLEGTTKSNQKEVIPVTDHSNKVFEVYTFPRYEEKNGVRSLLPLEITVTAIDVYGNAVKERVLEDVPVTRNRITECTGDFFAGGVLEYTNIGFGGLQVEQDWAGIDNYALPD